MERVITFDRALKRIQLINELVVTYNYDELEAQCYETLPPYKASKFINQSTDIKELINLPFYRFHMNDNYKIKGINNEQLK